MPETVREPAHPSPEGVRAAAGAVLIAEWTGAIAALIHLWAVPEHLAEWWGYGAFFVGAALFQGGYALALARHHGNAMFLAGGVAVNVAIVALWVVSRTAGSPRPGPESGHVHEVGPLDSLATGLEAGLVVALVLLFLHLPRPVATRPGTQARSHP